jgi:hypothetical protein
MLSTHFQLVPLLSIGAAMLALPGVTSGHVREPLYILPAKAGKIILCEFFN